MTVRLAFCGHIDPAHLIDDVVGRVIESEVEAVILTGNLGRSIEQLEEVLVAFDAYSGVKAVITGNEDVWQRTEDERSSQQLWEETLPIIFRKHQFVWLEQRNIILGHIGICGTTAWYDYSGRDVNLGYSVRQYQSLKGLTNEDANYIHWDFSDVEFAMFVLDNFTKRLDNLEADGTTDKIVVVTHFPIFLENIPEGLSKRERFDLAYRYNLTVGRTVFTKRKLVAVISGHGNQREHQRIHFGNHSTDNYVLGSIVDYPQPLILDI